MSFSPLSRRVSSTGIAGDVRGDVRVLAGVDQRDPGRVADEPDGGQWGDAGVHGDAPFDGQVEPDPWLCA